MWLPRSCSTWSGCAPTSQSLCCSRFLNACVAFCTLCAGPEVAGDLEDSGESGRPACTRAHAGEWRQVEARKLAECWAKMSKTDSSRASVVCSVGCLALWGVGVGVGGGGSRGTRCVFLVSTLLPTDTAPKTSCVPNRTSAPNMGATRTVCALRCPPVMSRARAACTTRRRVRPTRARSWLPP